MNEAAVTYGLLERLACDINAADAARQSGGDADALVLAAQANATENIAFLKEVIQAYGWPASARFGEQAQAVAGWLLTFSAEVDPPFQAMCLDLLVQALAQGEADAEFFAFTTDRVLLAQGGAQRYGTQVQHRDGYNVIMEPVEDPHRLNARRRAVGLAPLTNLAPVRCSPPGTARRRPARRARRDGRRQ
jgi:hypothetical protein